jgi:hypothetical protein
MPSTVLTDLTAEIARDTTVKGSAATFIRGVPTLIQAAIAKALDNGATEAQLAPFVALNAEMKAGSDDLVAAILEGTEPTAAMR